MEKSIEIAEENGVGLVAVKNSNHFGITAFYSLLAAQKDKIGIVISNVAPLMPAIGGKEKVIGNNPISIAAPSKEKPIVLDMALSNTALGKVIFHKENNMKIPKEWGVDAEGVTHIKHMFKTTGPALVLSIITFHIFGLRYRDSEINQGQIDSINSSLSEIFHIGWIAFIPAAVVLTLLLMRKPPVTSIFTGAIIGVIVGVVYQGFSIESGFDALYNGFSIETGNDFIDGLLNRGGVVSMLDIIALFIFAMGLGGVLSGSGMLGAILTSFAYKIKTNRGLLLMTIVVTYITNMVGATITFAHVMTATIMKPLYEKKRLKPENLSRVIEDSGTLASPIIPWNTSSIFAASALGISAVEFIPYSFLTYFTLAITIIYSITGFTITSYDDNKNDESTELDKKSCEQLNGRIFIKKRVFTK